MSVRLLVGREDRRLRVLVASLALLASVAATSSGAYASGDGGFVRVRGNQLVLAGKPFRIHGASIYLTSNPGGSGDINQVVRWARAAGINTIRIVNFIDERGIDPDAPYAEEDWRRVDRILDRLRRADLHAILDLSAFRNHLVNRGIVVNDLTCGPGQLENRDYAKANPYRRDLKGEWRRFVRFMANRKNTVNQRTYHSDPTIAVISVAGEPAPPGSAECGKPASGEELTEFYKRTFRALKRHDQKHVLSNGGFTHIDWEELYGGSSGIDWQAVFALDNNDLPSIHTYVAQYDGVGDPVDHQSPKVDAYLDGLGKPWFTEEFGWKQDVGDAVRADRYQWVYDEQQALGSAGAAFWNLGHEVAPGTHDVNPPTPLTWDVVGDNAPPDAISTSIRQRVDGDE